MIKILNANGSITQIGDAGDLNGIMSEILAENTTPAVYNDDGSLKEPEVVPDINTLALALTDEQIKTHAWRLPRARRYRLTEIRNERNAKLKELDIEYQLADEGVHPGGLSKTQVAASKQALRDLPPTAESHLDGLTTTADIEAYDPLAP